MRVGCVAAVSLTVGAITAWALVGAWLSAHSAVTAAGPASLDELVILTASSLALAIAAWLCAGTLLELLSHVPGRIGRVAQRWSDRLTPALARRVAAFVLGVGVGVAGGPTQSVAAPRGSGSSVVASVADPGFLPAPSSSAPANPATPAVPADPGFAPAPPEAGFTPASPTVRPQPDPGLLAGRPHRTGQPGDPPLTGAHDDAQVVVHRGDSLWSIAARHLGPRATDAEIAAEWPRWFEANRSVIGDDPDRILPGQILRVPDAQPTASVNR
ncbi:hypothetical protein N803_16380 [Knoellia subterranea KCTC 19937]|uniref:LysM domain-containing protein n=1 Tax=Knoellia subterranea KCTC 19937 TaxID=1385521 RepID=A0A0A0JLU7_9MICO|nr:hypothetical protein N803_16380 [Knoellia subterranea KCTC 19937]